MTSALRLEYLPLSSLQPAAKNPKRHHGDISKSIGRFGYVEPIVVDGRTKRLVAGHGRQEALLKMHDAGEAPPSGVQEKDGEWLVPVLCGWSSRSDAEADAYLIASNRLTTLGGWDEDELAGMLAGLAEDKALEGIGYSLGDVEDLMLKAGGAAPAGDGKDEKPEKAPKVPTSVSNVFQVLVEVGSEDEQSDLMMKLEGDGYKCRPLIF